ncbi:lipocalin family protein [Shewanella gelidii]|uniref:Outer membrane lipoprotein Blc n=1 Tax=Shewanella gelidii TaxID=1642821 RepID=A0A917JRA3_9GAMM|nr:lipocalin family protein [Shewanella gelidii]MCL1097658.1 lipocalin family protein [Shewanella gelidii]GGI79818.1 hypothetical protein GCM10009332_16490 [Shewanella gelidii]
MKRLWMLCVCVWLTACVGVPDGVKPVNNFELERYLGTWYEVARLDHSFERGLTNVSATYRMRSDGGVAVLNRGYDAVDKRWKEADGKAYFVESPDSGYLKVSFFGPFYGAYVVFELEAAAYQYAFVSGPDHEYLWLLSRTPQVSEQVKQAFLDASATAGFDTDALIWVNQKSVSEVAKP